MRTESCYSIAGPWPISVAQEKPVIGYPLAFEHPGRWWRRRQSWVMTLARLTGITGIFHASWKCKGCGGAVYQGNHVWVEVKNLRRLEAVLRGLIFIIVWVSMQMWCRCCMRRASIWV